jgi:hypothetical protein
MAIVASRDGCSQATLAQGYNGGGQGDGPATLADYITAEPPPGRGGMSRWRSSPLVGGSASGEEAQTNARSPAS